ncbi:transcriptional regulator CtsR [Caminicella sporogenes DSM 14501]|uniref:Transcriptional regulator CtsR n=1 Tax=Caminicella sporogenes DSM 14501 TaxID=1121266 RepID=A0A1M6SSA1_9FIRM|nr:CtsR family transcriptional regulator [Caminicella sporogenes]RKD26406.1 CtsR family transcriptional regulator [Caminicella sporogenes]SHK47604.1 transcriptional regulator CtsR [Caminicella sporogenes DSM 14501]
MARLSDLIEAFIKEMLKQSNKQWIEIKRNELANDFNCAPSQINYVLSTRFTIDKGYAVESRRGGGGHIRIIKLNINKKTYLYNIINEIGDSISMMKAVSIVKLLLEKGILKDREADIMIAALNNRSLNIDTELKNNVRASILKAMLASLLR